MLGRSEEASVSGAKSARNASHLSPQAGNSWAVFTGIFQNNALLFP